MPKVSGENPSKQFLNTKLNPKFSKTINPKFDLDTLSFIPLYNPRFLPVKYQKEVVLVGRGQLC